MRISHFISVLFLAFFCVSLLGLSGCSMFSSSAPPPPTTQPPASTQPRDTNTHSLDSAKKRAEQIAAQLERNQSNPPKEKPIRWDQQPTHPKPAAPQPAATQATTQPTAKPAATEPTPKPAAAPRLTIAQLVGKLTRRIASSDESSTRQAIAALGLSFTRPDWQMDERLLAQLTPDERDQIEKLHQITEVFARRIEQDRGPLSRDALNAQLDQLFGTQPIAITRLELCKQVSGFGVYKPFQHHSFVAGTDHKMIVYVELKHFRPVKQPDGQYRVKLKQKVMLFNVSDGLVVWEHKPVELVDTSRNRRHDFFIVQLIDLPANLSVGKYRLKVRITDEQGGSLDEQTTNLQIVADKALVDHPDQGG